MVVLISGLHLPANHQLMAFKTVKRLFLTKNKNAVLESCLQLCNLETYIVTEKQSDRKNKTVYPVYGYILE